MLIVHRSERSDHLVGALGEVLATPLPDPMQAEVIAVPTRGVERWLIQHLSLHLGAGAGRTDGICGNVAFPFPGSLLGRAAHAALGGGDQADPWAPERAAWPLLDIVEEANGAGWLGPLATRLDDRRFAAVRHVSDLFDRYAVHRPAMLLAWAEGRDVDATGAALPEDLAWQAELWRRLRARIDSPSPPERHDEACARLRADRDACELPSRLSLYGLTRLPATQLDLLDALAAQREVHLFLLHPSPELWREVAAVDPPRTPRRADDPTAGTARHPLLASWGRDAREMQLTLGRSESRHHPVDERPSTLLERIQADIRANVAPPGPPRPGDADGRLTLEPTDRSIQVHSCHGRARQVEVVRDAILHLLADDPTLEPRDVIVMCPDIEQYAPLIHATFRAADIAATRDEGGLPDLRVRLADRSLRQTNPVLGVLTEVLRLADGRATAPEVLDLAAREPVRRRFGLDEDDLASLEAWVADSGIRWGVDGPAREPFGLEDLRQNTWQAGLDRILLGVAMSEEEARFVGGVLPLGRMETQDVDLAGRLAELVNRLGHVLTGLRPPRTVVAWGEAIREATDLLTLSPGRREWERAEVDRIVDAIVDEAQSSEVAISLSEIRGLLADRLRGRPTRASFRTGHLTVCTLVPMRSVPHRVVCLLGLDDGAFPRNTAGDGDDIVLRDPHVGDRDARGEDRQLLLDALMAATDTLVITYSGHDERTNAELPPAVPVAELLDVVDATARAVTGDARDHLLRVHPLLPVDARNFTPGALGTPGPWGFDRSALEGARARQGPRRPRPPFLATPLDPRDDAVIALDDLVAFVEHPVRRFLRDRLHVWLPRSGEGLAAALPIDLAPLEEWAVGDRLLQACLAGMDLQAAIELERARGLLPPAALAAPALERVVPDVEALLAAATDRGWTVASETVAADVTLPDGTRIRGAVGGCRGDVVIRVSYSRLGSKHRIAAWVRHLALRASDPPAEVTTITLGRGESRGQPPVAATLGPVDDPAGLLADIVALHRQGLTEPLPLYCKTSAAYAEGSAGSGSPGGGLKSAKAAWEDGLGKECGDPNHLVVLGDSTVEDLLEGLRPTEPADGWPSGEEHRLGLYARRLFDPMLENEDCQACSQ